MQNHTVELDSQEAKWVLDALRWAKEHSDEKGYTRNKNKLSRVDDRVREQLPDYAELADDSV